MIDGSSSKVRAQGGRGCEAGDARHRYTRRIVRRVIFALVGASVVACMFVPSLRAGVGEVFDLLSSGDLDAVAGLIRAWGPWAAAVSFCLMILQSLAAPIPAFLITFANAAVFGWWQGALLSWSSSMVGAALCFGIARVLGRDAVAHFATKGALEKVDAFFGRIGTNAVFICRLLPFMSFDVVSYAAGLTAMRFWGFFWATGLGQLPATLVYSYVGGMLTGGMQMALFALLAACALVALFALLKQVYDAQNEVNG